MKCYVCHQPAHACEATPDVKCATCESCGSYQVSGALLAEKLINKLSFDVDQTRAWLNDQRHIGVDVPLLATTNVRWSR